jgi:hypothetical protein
VVARYLPLAAVRDVERDEEYENAFMTERGHTPIKGGDES